MIRLVVLLIILIPICYFIGKWAVKAWHEADIEEDEGEVEEALEKAKLIDDLYKKVKKVDVDKIEKEKDKIDEVKDI